MVVRKYYRPLDGPNVHGTLTNAKQLFSKIFSLSNSPEMRLVPDDKLESPRQLSS